MINKAKALYEKVTRFLPIIVSSTWIVSGMLLWITGTGGAIVVGMNFLLAVTWYLSAALVTELHRARAANQIMIDNVITLRKTLVLDSLIAGMTEDKMSKEARDGQQPPEKKEDSAKEPNRNV